MKRNIIVFLLAIMGFSVLSARPIPVKRKSLAFQHGRMRMPSSTQVEADYENGVITVNIAHYTGNIQVFVYDANGFIFSYSVSTILDSDTVTLKDNFTKGDYTLCLVLDSSTYSGEFSI